MSSVMARLARFVYVSVLHLRSISSRYEPPSEHVGSGGGGGSEGGRLGGCTGGGGDGASKGSVCTVLVPTACTSTPSAAERSVVEVSLSTCTAVEATVALGVIIVALTLMLAGDTERAMSVGMTPGSCAARFAAKAASSNDATSPARVNTVVTTGR